jgi:ssDNA-binding Zn-finger/Zn-ribbon topoisomerase 1
LFGLRTALRYTHTCTIDSFHDAKYEAGWRPTELFEREFGIDWTAMRHPEFRARILPSIEKAVAANVADFAGEKTIAPPVVLAGFSGTGVLVVESDIAANRWDVIPKLFSLTIPLWIALSVCVVIVDFISRERKAQRWVAHKCPKCGYERQRDRAECPECGLVYERPSYVMWDPTEEAAREGVRRDDT